MSIDVRPAGKRCRCKHSATHPIVKGETRVVVKEPGVAAGEAGYCAACALAMIEKARAALDALEREVLTMAGVVTQ